MSFLKSEPNLITVFKKIIKATLIAVGIAILFFIGYFVFITYALGGFDKDYSVTDLKNNFNEKKVEIYELQKYFNEIVPKNRCIEIEFDNDNTLGRFGITARDRTGEQEWLFLEWDLKTNTSRMDSIGKSIGWTRQTFETIKEKLDNANCIQIESGEPTKIGFKRYGMGMYSFVVFSKSIPDSLKSMYNDSCTYILVDEKLALEYGGGAIGTQCFYNKE